MEDNNFEELLNYSYYLGTIRHRTGSLLLSFLATSNKIDEIGDTSNWYIPDDKRRNNKDRMKELGGALMGYRKYHRELTIIGISKTIEDLIVDFKEVSNYEFKMWKSKLQVKHFEDIKYIRQLNNSIKHSRGIVLDDDSHSNRYLINHCKVSVNTDIGNNLKIDIEDYILRSFIFQMDLCSQILEIKNVYENEDKDSIKKMLIPETIIL